MAAADDLFERIVCESGLNPAIGKTALRRALLSVGIEPDEVRVTDLRRALPAIETCLRVFLPYERTKDALRKIGQLK